MTLGELLAEFQNYKNVEIRISAYDEPTEAAKAENAYIIHDMKTGEIYISIVGSN